MAQNGKGHAPFAYDRCALPQLKVGIGPARFATLGNDFNSNDTTNKFTTTLKTLVGDTFTYQVANGGEVRYLYITTDGAYEKANDVPGRINVVRYTYDYSAGHTSEKTTRLLKIEYGTAGWKKNTGFDDFIATS